VGDARLFAFVRGHLSAPLLAIHNLTDLPSVMDPGVLGALGLARALDALEPQETFDAGRPVILAPYATRWLVTAGDPLQDGSDGGGTQGAGAAG